MEINECFPKGGINKMWEVLHLEVKNAGFSGISIQGRTNGRDGSEIHIFYKGEQMSHHRYNYHQSPGYHNDMARNSSEDINTILEMEGISSSITAKEILPLMDRVRDKCESRYGNPLPDSEYEVLVTFN